MFTLPDENSFLVIAFMVTMLRLAVLFLESHEIILDLRYAIIRGLVSYFLSCEVTGPLLHAALTV